MKCFTPAILLLLVGCNRIQQAPKRKAMAQHMERAAAPKDAPQEDWEKTFRKRMAQSFHDQNPPSKIPPTGRTIEPFRRLKLGMTRREVISKVGMSDKNAGSGIYVDIYKLSDGSIVTLGSADTLIYGYHQPKNGKEYDLLKSKTVVPSR